MPLSGRRRITPHMAVSNPLPVADAEWLAHRYDAQADRIRFCHVPRARHREISFLTDDNIGDAPIVAFDRQKSVMSAPSGTAHFIFHSAFCASTMLVRAMDHHSIFMGLSEPVILNDIVGYRRRGEFQPPDVARALGDALTLLARPFATDEPVIIKPSNVLNTLAGAMLAIRPDSKALFLYAPLPVFLASVARKGMWCRLWARELLEGLLQEGAVNLGFETKDYFRLTDLQVAAVGWLAQHALFQALAGRVGPERLRALDSEILMADQGKAVAALAIHFGRDAAQAATLADNPALRRHSKTGAAFDADQRREEQQQARAAYGDEIEKVSLWAEAVARNAGISLDSAAHLLDHI